MKPIDSLKARPADRTLDSPIMDCRRSRRIPEHDQRPVVGPLRGSTGIIPTVPEPGRSGEAVESPSTILRHAEAVKAKDGPARIYEVQARTQFKAPTTSIPACGSAARQPAARGRTGRRTWNAKTSSRKELRQGGDRLLSLLQETRSTIQRPVALYTRGRYASPASERGVPHKEFTDTRPKYRQRALPGGAHNTAASSYKAFDTDGVEGTETSSDCHEKGRK